MTLMLPVGIATAVLTFSKRKANPMTYFLYDDLIEAFPTEAQALAYVALAEGKADDNWRVS